MKNSTFINDEKYFEKALQASEEKFRLFVESTRCWIVEVDNKGFYTYCNPSVEYILGYHPDEMIGSNRLKFVHKNDYKKVRKFFEECVVKKQGWNDKLFRWKHKNGSYRYLEYDGTPILDNSGNIQGFRIIGRDVTQRKLQEEQRFQHQHELSMAARQGAMQALVGILAHDLAQPLTVINNFVTGCMWQLKSKNYDIDHLLDALYQVTQQVAQMSTIMQNTEKFLKQKRLYYELIDVNPFIKKVLSRVQMFFPIDKTHIKYDLLDQNIFLKIDKLYVELVILNLVHNAIEAKEQDSLNHHEIIIKTQITSDNLLCFQVIDSNAIIIKDVVEKTFDPFFSTKKNGSGIDFSMLRTIIEAHGGDLLYIPQSRKGAFFKFTLPIYQI